MLWVIVRVAQYGCVARHEERKGYDTVAGRSPPWSIPGFPSIRGATHGGKVSSRIV